MACRLLPELDPSLLSSPATPRPRSRGGRNLLGAGSRNTPLGTAHNSLTPSTATSSAAASLVLATPRAERPATVSGADLVGKFPSRFASRTFDTPSHNGGDSPKGVNNRFIKYDKLRLREWFNAMDVDHSGHVKRAVFLRFLIDNPQLRDVICSIYASTHGDHFEGRSASKESTRAGSKASVCSASFDLMDKSGCQDKNVDQAIKYRRVIAAWKEIDADKSGTLEWEEFVEYFRVNGFLIEYQVANNPKDRMTNLLASMHDNPEDLDADEMEEFTSLRGQHTDVKRSSTLGVIEASNILNTMTPAEDEDPENPSLVRRRSSLSKVAAPPRRTSTSTGLPGQIEQLLTGRRGSTTPLNGGATPRITTEPLFS